MKLLLLEIFAVACSSVLPSPALAQSQLTVEQVMAAPFSSDLVAAKSGTRIAWFLNQQGKRNIWVAEAPAFTPRQLTSYNVDDGAELSDLSFTADGEALLYVRGGGKNSTGEYANPTSDPAGQQQSIWQIPFRGGSPKKIDEGDSPVVSAQGKVAYTRAGQMWLASLQAEEKSLQIVVRGKNEPIAWSPEGQRLLFVSHRGDHSFIGIYDPTTPHVNFLAPTVDSDTDPVWSLDGKQVAFARRPALQRDTPDGYFIAPDRPHPWAIWVANSDTGEAREIWHSGAAPDSAYPVRAHEASGVLNWAAENHLVFPSEQDGWQHLYSLPTAGGTPHLLTPGNCEVEEWSFSPDKKSILFNSNCGDIDRRHLWGVTLQGEPPAQITKGDGIEWAPVFLTDSSHFAYLGSNVTEPGHPFTTDSATPKTVALNLPPFETWRNSPAPNEFLTPQSVIFDSADGFKIHAQLFLPKNLKPGEKRPTLIFLHGGPMRQMLLGWHYMYYYANAYAMNQYLASRGYIVLAINYRSGIGYGRAFREAPRRAGRGASEYQDVVAAAKYLQIRSDVNPHRIGLWGGSYGGYLTALGLARNSDLFAAGVDFHGVHDWPLDNSDGKNISPEMIKLAHDSSPVSSVDTWKSPVLFIHGDDDRTVYFTQTVDLVARLREHGVHIEQLILPDEDHDFLLHRSWVKAYQATSNFFDQQFAAPQK